MGVAVDALEAKQLVGHSGEDAMANQVDGVLVVARRRHLADVISLHQFQGQNPAGGVAVDHVGNDDPVVFLVEFSEQPQVVRFVDIIQLFLQPLTNLSKELVDCFLGHFQQAAQFQRQAQLLQVGIAGIVHTGVLHFDNNVGAVVQAGAVDLADGGRGIGLLLQVFEQLGNGLAQFGFDLLDDHRERHRRRFFLQGLQGVGEFLGQKILGL